ncbi:MAG: acetylornithine deacetylase [Alphaproteobacteria bacterium]|nr:acetylornithine deacetylase [Alphaproteobacteria bacterium]MBV9693573.1 acetylornithine deacetylase [Alphaproteobacteria bacterium]
MTTIFSPTELTARLIAFDTTSRLSNLALIDFAQDMLEANGARCRRSHNADGSKANLFASLGPDRDGGIVLSGHTDVVPVDGQDWSSDPFKAETHDGRLFGRGACDMKGFVATALSLVGEIAAAKLARPIHFALSFDEEVGCAGVPALLDDLRKAGIKPALAIVGEPTMMKVVGAHKGGTAVRTRCKGHEGHSSAPQKGASAVMMAGEFVSLIARLGRELEADCDPRFEPPFTTTQANVISGGTALNILAGAAQIVWECRPLPGRDGRTVVARAQALAESDILPRYRRGAPEAAIESTITSQYPGLALDPESPAVALALELTGANRAETVAYGTEAGHFQAAGIPAVICGPGSIDQAHKADEFVDLSQLEACEAFLRKVIAKAVVG